MPVEAEYVRRQRAGSILCLRLVKRSKLIGVLYLEDKLTFQVFTTKRLVMLEPLASQAAIALHNARLYAVGSPNTAYNVAGRPERNKIFKDFAG